ncbi:MAG: phosphatidate cytidylyltransferase [Actinomycetota bacterium]
MDQDRGFRPPNADDDDAADDGPVFRFDPEDTSSTTGSSLFGDVPDLEPGEAEGLFSNVPDLLPGETSELFSDAPDAPDASPEPPRDPTPPPAPTSLPAPDEPVVEELDVDEVDEVEDAAADVISLAPPVEEGADDEAADADGVPAFRFDETADDATGPLPHWTEPATGVLQLGADEPEPAPEPGVAFRRTDAVGDEESLDAWTAMDAPRPVWSDGTTESEPEPVRIGSTTPPTTTGVWQEPEVGTTDLPARDDAGRDLPMAIVSGVALAALLFGLLSFAPPGGVVALVAFLAVLAQAELFTTLRRAGHRPAHLLGLVATGGVILGTYWKGAAAYPIVLALLVLFAFATYVIEPVDKPLFGVSVTLAGVLWIGVGASFASLLLRGTHGTGAFIAAVVGTVAHDVGAYAVGRVAGRSHLSPEISPNKTWEGLIGGMAAAVLGLGLLSAIGGIAPVDQLLDALLIGVAIAIAAPIGDLAESLVKRDLEVKDMGSVLPGHGGFLDRFDGLLFALPTVWLMLLALDLAPVGTMV